MKILSYGKYIKIGGINHPRYIGIVKNGEQKDLIFTFDPRNVEGYRTYKDEAERKACIAKAEEYYNECCRRVLTGKFFTYEEEITTREAETDEEFNMLCDELGL